MGTHQSPRPTNHAGLFRRGRHTPATPQRPRVRTQDWPSGGWIRTRNLYELALKMSLGRAW
jgi:hypothetical protein